MDSIEFVDKLFTLVVNANTETAIDVPLIVDVVD
jgi:hypothetical protein